MSLLECIVRIFQLIRSVSSSLTFNYTKTEFVKDHTLATALRQSQCDKEDVCEDEDERRRSVIITDFILV